jgi:hypothetical protein
MNTKAWSLDAEVYVHETSPRRLLLQKEGIPAFMVYANLPAERIWEGCRIRLYDGDFDDILKDAEMVRTTVREIDTGSGR